jgi:hypothetical protein
MIMSWWQFKRISFKVAAKFFSHEKVCSQIPALQPLIRRSSG